MSTYPHWGSPPTDISQQLQFQDDGHLLHGFSRLCITWSLIGSRAELEITQSAASTFQQYYLLSVIGNIADVFSRFGIIHHGTTRHINVNILSVGTMTLVATAISTVLGKNMALVL